jgi:hypothetical protein
MTTQAAIRKIAEGLYELADALFAEEAVAAVAAPVTARPSAIPEPFEEVVDELFPVKGEGSLAQCPSHRINFMAGKFGPFCPAKSDDLAWANKKGYCTITPDSAAEWLRITAA